MPVPFRRRWPLLSGLSQHAAIASYYSLPRPCYKVNILRTARPLPTPRLLLNTIRPVTAVVASAPRRALLRMPPLKPPPLPRKVIWYAGLWTPPYDLFDAVIAQLRALLNGVMTVHAGWAGPNVAPPYAELYIDDGPRTFFTYQDFFEPCTLHVNVYTTKRDPRTADMLASALNRAPLSFTKGVIVTLRCTGEYFDKSRDPGPGGGTIYQETRMFEAIFSNSY